MTSKESNDPILTLNSKNIKNDILMFKNDALKDFKDAQRKISEKYQSLDLEIQQKLESYENRINAYENKIIELSNLINTDKTIRDKVENLIEFKEKAEDNMLTEKIRLDNFRNDLKSNVERIDQILKDSVIYPGVVGGICRYKTFHDLIDYILTECSQNLTFREKSIIDFKSYKTKLENSISSFNTQINTLLNTTSEYTKNCVKELEEKVKSIFNVYDDRLQESRIENANYAIGLEKATDVLKKELQQLYVIKKELYEKVDIGIAEIKTDNTRVVKLFTGYKKNFILMQHKFTQLSDFIKDIRFRINIKEDVKRREYSHMSDLINFDKKKKGFYDGINNYYNILKKGMASQVKEYIDGKITADQVTKKKTESKSVGKLNENTQFNNININNEINKRKSISTVNKNFNKYGEDVKLNFVDLIKSAVTKRMSFENEDFKKQKSFIKKEIIKEEDDENNNSSKELNSIFFRTAKEKKINPNLFEKVSDKKKEDIIIDKDKDKKKEDIIVDKDKDKKKEDIIVDKDKDKKKEDTIIDKDKDKKKEDTIIDKDKKKEDMLVDKDKDKTKENIIVDKDKTKEDITADKDKDKDKNRKNSEIKQKQEESKIQIVSKNIDDEKEKKDDNDEKKPPARIKNVIGDLFSLRKIIENIANQNNETSSNSKIINQNDKNKNNVSKTNDNSVSNNLYNDIKKDAIKTKPVNKNFIRPATVMNIKKNNNNYEKIQNKTNEIRIITNNDTSNEPKSNRIISKRENKKVGNVDFKKINITIYNPTLNSVGDYIETIHYKVNNNRKKANSTNKNNKNYFMQQTTATSTKKSQIGVRKDDTRAVDNMFNNINNFLPKVDNNLDSNNLFGIKKKK